MSSSAPIAFQRCSALHHKINKADAEGVLEDKLSSLKIDAMLDPVTPVLRRIPFKLSHSAQPKCTYVTVITSSNRFSDWASA